MNISSVHHLWQIYPNSEREKTGYEGLVSEVIMKNGAYVKLPAQKQEEAIGVRRCCLL